MPVYQVRHATSYAYSEPVSISMNQAYLTPRSGPAQVCVESRLAVDPRPAVSSIRPDYFGNTAALFTVQEPHRELEIVVRSVVEVSRVRAPHPLQTPPWDASRAMLARDSGPQGLEARQFLFESDYAPALPEAAAYAAPSFLPGRPLLDAAIELMERIRGEFAYEPGATSVATPVAEVLASRRGVCQDFAHLQIACLRALGLAARYVSGYVLTAPPAGGERLVGADASHAWLALYCPGFGWVDLDPTNALIPSGKHVTLAWGRDYGDVCPVKGIVLGGGAQTLSVAVDVVQA